MATQNQINSNFWRIVTTNVDGTPTELTVNIPGANVTGEVAFAAVANSVAGANVSGDVTNANYANYTGDVVNSAQGNITSLGILTGLAVVGTASVTDLHVTGNVLGPLLPDANITYDLGSPTQRWKDLWLTGTTIYLGDSALSMTSGNLTVDGNVLISQSINGVTNLGEASNLTITGGTTGQVLSTDGTGNLSWTTVSSNTSEITNTDGFNTFSVSVANTGVVSMNTARGGLEFGAMPEIGGPTHLHIMRPAGQEGSSDLFFGDDYNYVKMPGLYGPGTQGVEIGSSYNSGPVSTWRFDTSGNLSLPGNTFAVNYANGTQIPIGGGDYGDSNVVSLLGSFGSNNISTTGNVTANNFVGNISITENIVGTGSNVSLVAGSFTTTFDNTGVATFPGNVTTSGNFVGNGASLTGVAIRTTGAWTVTSGTNTYSITVPVNGNYQMWVRGNIPNGILVYQATVSVSNNNVPVLGTQRAWNYTTAGSPILLITMPTQIVGAEDTISTASLVTTTANVFDFVISNTSGSPQTVYWGYVTL